MSSTKIQLAVNKTEVKKITILPTAGYTAARIIEMLNKHEAVINGDQIVTQCVLSSEGFHVVAEIHSEHTHHEHGSWHLPQAQKK